MRSRLAKLLIALLCFSLYGQAQTSLDQRIDDLLSSMTLPEKIGQMAQINITEIIQDSIADNYGEVTHYVIDTAKLERYLRDYHIGSFLNGRAVTAENWAYVTATIQSINQKYSKVPILYGIDHVHGASYLKGATIFPHNLNIGCTFDTLHAFRAAQVAAVESADLGHNWIFAPVLGIGRAKWWGRYYETYGEDPHVVTRMGVAAINGIQNPEATAPYHTAACAKHFIGYSDPSSGWDRAPALIPDQTLREFFLPPFRAAVEAGVKTMMINSGEVNGIPVHASHELLTGLLREELGFEGIVLTDWLDIIALETMHYVAENEKEATYQAIMAGVDMSMVPKSPSFCVLLAELVREGRIPESRIDESVRRILKVKLELGLFVRAMPRTDRLDRIQSPEHIRQARRAAEESIVLVKNANDLLPLKGQKILVAGPTARNKTALCGGWTYRFAADGDRWFPEDMPHFGDALQSTFGDQVTWSESADLVEKARGADLIVLALGEPEAYAETQGTIDDLSLPIDQRALFALAAATGKPIVIVLIEGRPRLIPDLVDRADAILFAGLPGIYGAQAIVDILTGSVNPSGKMAFTYPYQHGHIIPYNHKRAEFSIIRPVPEALRRFSIAPFGHGLSYTTFAYSDLGLDRDTVAADGSIEAQVTVTNTGDRTGKEAVLWFLSDEVGTITRPVKALKHFEKIELAPGESRTLTFRLDATEHCSYPDKGGDIVLEAGDFTLTVGGLTKRFYLEK